MFEKPEFAFKVSEGKKEGSIFLRIQAGGITPNQPEILIFLLQALESQTDISPLAEKYTQYKNTLENLRLVLSQGKVIVIKEQGVELHYDQVHGYSIHVRVELPTPRKE